MIKSDLEALEYMCPLPGPIEIEVCLAQEDLMPVVNEMPHHLLERQDLWPTIHKSQHNDTECRLKLGMLIQLIQHYLRVGVLFEFDNYPQTIPVRLIP